MMKILYVSALTTPLQEVLEGHEQISGLPGFYYPMKMLMERGHEVNFVILSNRSVVYAKKLDWIDPWQNVKAFVRYPRRQAGAKSPVIGKGLAYLKFMWAVHKELRDGDYDFVYCKATEAIGGQIVAWIHRVPVGVRWFGDLISSDIEKYGVYGAALRRPVDFLGLKAPCSFMVITDDNPTMGHRYRSWLPKWWPYDLFIWRSGIEFKLLESLIPKLQTPDSPYIFYGARFDLWKRQDRIVGVLNEVRSAGYNVHLYLAGGIDDPAYYSRVVALVSELGLESYVHFLGRISNDDVRSLSHHAVAHPFMCDGRLNLGNAFFEAFAGGAAVIAIDDGSLNEFIDDGVNGFLIRDEREAAETVIKLLGDPDLSAHIRENASATARRKVESADQRFGREVALIESFERRVESTA